MDDSDFDYGYDEGSDIDNWETEQVFQDNEGVDEERFEEPEMAEDAYLDSAYEDLTCLGDE